MLLAEGPLGWGITPFEGNLYIRKKYLLTDKFKVNFRVSVRTSSSTFGLT
jgi:hypothetical protein